MDTGPLVAVLSSSDEHHEICVNMLRTLPGPLLSCWPVITEAVWLLRTYQGATQQLLSSIGEVSLRCFHLQAPKPKRSPT